jgi:hypothetical protein
MDAELQAFEEFKFQLGEKVCHRASRRVSIVIGRMLFQAQTGNTGHCYVVSGANGYLVYEIELEPAETKGDDVKRSV